MEPTLLRVEKAAEEVRAWLSFATPEEILMPFYSTNGLYRNIPDNIFGWFHDQLVKRGLLKPEELIICTNDKSYTNEFYAGLLAILRRIIRMVKEREQNELASEYKIRTTFMRLKKKLQNPNTRNINQSKYFL